MIAALAFGLVGPPSASAASGELDPSFGSAGISVLDLGGEESARAMATDASGRIVTAGEASYDDPSRPGATLPSVVRFLNDGSLDLSYGGGDGVVQVDTGRYTGRFEAVMVDGAGRIVAAGTAVGFDGAGSEVVVARFLEDGSPDPSFGGGDGVVEVGPTGIWVARDAIIDSEGRIVIAAMSDGPGGLSPTAIRLLGDGSPDGSFGAAGVLRVIPGRFEIASGVAETGSGELILAGASSKEGMAAIRIDDDGRVDVRFGKRGFAKVRLPGTAAAEAVIEGPDRSVVLAGSCECREGERVAVASLVPRGRPNRDFGRKGVATFRLGGPNASSRATALAEGPTGIFNVGASADVAGPGARAALIRMTRRGKLDTRFSKDGVSSPSFRFNGSIYANNTVEAVAIDGPAALRTSKILMAGSVFGATTDLAVARLEP